MKAQYRSILAALHAAAGPKIKLEAALLKPSVAMMECGVKLNGAKHKSFDSGWGG